jgi:uncharacterized damage-inducible protein DinB
MPGDQKALLRGYLAAQRRHVLGILDGLDDEQLHRALLPSGWSCMSLVQHLTVDVERFWFRCAVAGERDVVDAMMTEEQDSWQVDPGVVGSDVLAAYRRETDLADAVIEQTDLAAAPKWWPVHLFGDWRLDSLGDVLLHVIAETATHAGHLDAARELIDGRQWLVLTS